jgi:hypothetical protein
MTIQKKLSAEERKAEIIAEIRSRAKTGKAATYKAGQTNAINPLSLGALLSKISTYEQAEATPVPALPVKQPHRHLPVDPIYQDMAGRMGTCPYELATIMEGHYGEDNEMVFELLKKFVAMVKLTNAINLDPIQKQLKEVAARNRTSDEFYERELSRITSLQANQQRDVQKAEQVFRDTWRDILIDLQTKLQRNSDLTKLGDMDRWNLMALSTVEPEVVKIHQGHATLDFAEACKIPAKEIKKLPGRADQMRETHRVEQWMIEVERTPIEGLMRHLWGLDPNNKADKEQIEIIQHSIANRTGRYPVTDRYGNMDWNATFYGRNSVGEYDDDSYAPSDSVWHKKR